MLPFAQGVEEARYYVEEAAKDESSATKNIGNKLDPELEKEVIECLESEEIPHPDFEHLNPDELEFDNNMTQRPYLHWDQVTPLDSSANGWKSDPAIRFSSSTSAWL